MIVVTRAQVRSILTRTSGYLRTVCSHSLQPWRGCTYGNALCGAGCYVRHNGLLTRGAPWGSFLEVRTNAAERYRAQAERERAWGRKARGAFSIFMSSSTDPFVPQEATYGVTRAVLDAMTEDPPDELILQTHSHRVAGAADALVALGRKASVRVHLSIESDRDTLPGLARPASSVARRLDAARSLREAGVRVVITVAPLLPVLDPEAFFASIARVADAVVIDHFIGGDGSADGARTLATALPAAIRAVDPQALELSYRERMVTVARRFLPGRVGVGIDGFAARYLPD